MKIEVTGLPVFLLVLFVILRLAKIISWSWWWVFSPILIPVGMFFAIFLLCMLVAWVLSIIYIMRKKK